MFRNEANRLFFSGNTGKDALPILATLHNLIDRAGYADICFDFSASTRLEPSVMLPLVMTARSYRSREIAFDIVLPLDRRMSGLMRNTNWAHIMAPELFDPGQESMHHLETIQFRDPDQLFTANERAMNVILQQASGLDRGQVSALEWSLGEISDNVLNHADSPLGGFMQVVIHRG